MFGWRLFGPIGMGGGSTRYQRVPLKITLFPRASRGDCNGLAHGAPMGPSGRRVRMVTVGRSLAPDHTGQQHLMLGADRLRILVNGAGKGLEIAADVAQISDLVHEAVLGTIGWP